MVGESLTRKLEKHSMSTYRLPTIPYDLTAAVNRAAAATGSLAGATATHRAEYNGHRVTVEYNAHRKYWVTEYIWAGRVVLARGSFADCLAAAIAEYKRGALGTSVAVVVADTGEGLDYAQMLLLNGFLSATEAAKVDAAWRDARYDRIHSALEMEKRQGYSAVALLLQSGTVEEYEERLAGMREERRQANLAMWQRSRVGS